MSERPVHAAIAETKCAPPPPEAGIKTACSAINFRSFDLRSCIAATLSVRLRTLHTIILVFRIAQAQDQSSETKLRHEPAEGLAKWTSRSGGWRQTPAATVLLL